MLIVPEQYAGQLMKCPMCSNTFTAPALPAAPVASARMAAPAATVSTNAASGPPSGPPAPADDIFRLAPLAPTPAKETPPPAGDSFDIPQPESAEVSSPPPPVPPLAGYAHTLTVWISPRVVPWIGPAGLGLGFVLSFFTWVKAVTKENKVEELSAWGLAFSGRGNGLLVGYVLLLTLAVLVAVAAAVIPRLSIQLPPGLQQIMPRRSGIVGGLTVLAFLVLLLQLAVFGFGEETVSADGIPQASRTIWLRLAFLVNLAAAVGSALEFWLAMRKSRPLPRIDISW
jgi:hypothetical protein